MTQTEHPTCPKCGSRLVMCDVTEGITYWGCGYSSYKFAIQPSSCRTRQLEREVAQLREACEDLCDWADQWVDNLHAENPSKYTRTLAEAYRAAKKALADTTDGG